MNLFTYQQIEKSTEKMYIDFDLKALNERICLKLF